MDILLHSIIFIVAVFSVICIGYLVIPVLRHSYMAGKRDYMPESHTDKYTTPSLGGFLFVPVIAIVMMMYGLMRYELYTASIITATCIAFGIIGLWDDISKIWYKKGISETVKSCSQVLCAGICMTVWYMSLGDVVTWYTPCGVFAISSGWWIIPWGVFIIVGSSNAVNLTDGLDGLAATTVMWHAIGTYAIMAVLGVTKPVYSFVCAIIAGVSAGFIWHNSYPANVFMGDVGSLSLGAGIAVIAIMSGMEWFLPFTLIVPVINTLSVMIQVIGIRLFKRRVFRFAPIHHHFEVAGVHEATIVQRAAIITMISIICSIVCIYCTM